MKFFKNLALAAMTLVSVVRSDGMDPRALQYRPVTDESSAVPWERIDKNDAVRTSSPAFSPVHLG